jgi:nicotinamidase-related amidase
MKTKFGLDVPTTLAEFCRPQHMALLVYDMQIGIVRQVSDGAVITERVASVLDSARSSGVRVIFTRHMSLPLKLMGSFSCGKQWRGKNLPIPTRFSPGSCVARPRSRSCRS